MPIMAALGNACSASSETDRLPTAEPVDSPTDIPLIEGRLRKPDANGVRLPDGFESRVIAKVDSEVGDSGYKLPLAPDGAATFVDEEIEGGWYLAVNAEAASPDGGASAIRFDPDGNVADAYRITTGTRNCAGGAMPWGTWLSCEEYDNGYVWECDPTKPNSGKVHKAMGKFWHEAAAADPETKTVFLTEDQGDGNFYRYTPKVWPDLSAGTLEVAKVAKSGSVTWLEIPDPQAKKVPTRQQAKGATKFNGGEGLAIDVEARRVYFSTKGDNTIWVHDLKAETIKAYIRGGEKTILSGVDNLWLDTATDTLLVAEDGGDMQIVMITPDLKLKPLCQVVGHDTSEITGPTFSPDRSRLYFNSQRGKDGKGIGVVYEITGPFGAA